MPTSIIALCLLGFLAVCTLVWVSTRCRHADLMRERRSASGDLLAPGETGAALWFVCLRCHAAIRPMRESVVPAIRQTFEGHDESLAVASAKRAEVASHQRRHAEARRSGSTRPASRLFLTDLADHTRASRSAR